MTILEAVAIVKNGTINGVRGTGCATIVAADGRRYSLDCDAPILLRAIPEEDRMEQIAVADYHGEIESVEWSCDDSGAIYLND